MLHHVSADGVWGIIKAVDLPPNCPRSKTRDTPQEAAQATWEPGLTSKPGPGSLNKFVKVKVADLQLPPNQVPIKPADYTNHTARKSAFDKPAKTIPPFPHTCNLCGGRTLELFTSVEHEGGWEACKGRKKKR